MLAAYYEKGYLKLQMLPCVHKCFQKRSVADGRASSQSDSLCRSRFLTFYTAASLPAPFPTTSLAIMPSDNSQNDKGSKSNQGSDNSVKNNGNHCDQHQNDDYDEDDGDGDYPEFFQSIRSSTGLEIGVQVTWPWPDWLPHSQFFANDSQTAEPSNDPNESDLATSMSRPKRCNIVLELSTCLPESSMAPMFAGTEWAGTRVWRASVVTLQYMLQRQHVASLAAAAADPTATADHSDHRRLHLGPETTILELGCGLGVPGMILQAILGCRVTLTDMDTLIESLQSNLVHNRHEFTDFNKIQGRALDWWDVENSGTGSSCTLDQLIQESGGTDNEDLRTAGFDVVLNCDSIFEPLYGTSWHALLQCQTALLKRNPYTFMLISVERRRNDGIEKYLDAASMHMMFSVIRELRVSPWLVLMNDRYPVLV